MVVLLTSGWLQSWVAPPPSREVSSMPQHDFGVPEAFVPQRRIAEKRAKLLVGAAVAATAAALFALY